MIIDNFNEDYDDSITDPNILLERRVVTNTSYNIVIEINPTFTTNYFYDPYFKVYTNLRYSANSNPCRISLQKAEYVYHKRPKSIALTSTQRDFMIAILKDDYREGLTGWQYLCREITKLAKENGYNVDYNKLKMPDYSNLQWNPPRGF